MLFAKLKMKYRCPKCGELFEGKVAECPHCHQVFAWPSDKNSGETIVNNESEQSSLSKVEKDNLSITNHLKDETNLQIVSNNEQQIDNQDSNEKTFRPFEIKITPKSKKRGAKIALNICWFIFYGLWATILHFFTGILYFVSLIGIPFGIQVFKFLKLIPMPFNKNVAIKFNRSAGSIIGNILWLIFGLNFVYLIVCGIFYVIFRITIVGYPLAVQCVKIMKFLCAPFGAEIVEDGQFSKNKDTAYYQGLIESATLRFAMENTELADQLLEDMDDKNLDYMYDSTFYADKNAAKTAEYPYIYRVNNSYPFSPKYEKILPKNLRREYKRLGSRFRGSIIAFSILIFISIIFFVSGTQSSFFEEHFYEGIKSIYFYLIGLLLVIAAVAQLLLVLSTVLMKRDSKYKIYTNKYLYLMEYLDAKIIDKYIANKTTMINGSYAIEDLKNISADVDSTFAKRLLKVVNSNIKNSIISLCFSYLFAFLFGVALIAVALVITNVTTGYTLYDFIDNANTESIAVITVYVLLYCLTAYVMPTFGIIFYVKKAKEVKQFLNEFIKK